MLRRSLIVSLLLVAAHLALVPSPTLADGTGSLSGTVTGTPSGLPLDEITVQIREEPVGGIPLASTTTDGAGRYEFTGLETGDYYLRFSGSGVVTEFYNNHDTLPEADPVDVVDGAATTGVDVEMVEEVGSLSGTVTGDPSNAPLEEIRVELRTQSGGAPLAVATTDSAGFYEFTGLAPDDYYLRFLGDTVTSEFYNDKYTGPTADPVTVGIGPTTGIDVVLAELATISGTITDSDAQPLADVCVYHWDDDTGSPDSTDTRTDALGRYTVDGVAAGTAYVRFIDCVGERTVSSEFYENQPNLAEADGIPIAAGAVVTGIDAELDPVGATLSGTVTDEFGTPQAGVCVNVRSSENEHVGGGITAADGSYTADSVALDGFQPGGYRLIFVTGDGSTCAGEPLQNEYYDNAHDFESAVLIKVNDATPLTGFDAILTEDLDGDGIGNDADPDVDGDGIGNLLDGNDTVAGDGGGSPLPDTDRDGWDDVVDTDDDGDGTPDHADAFPLDETEDTDSDGDGVGDNADAFPNDPNEQTDSDGDGVGDNGDAFPDDPNEDTDSDGDGIGDNADEYPDDPTNTPPAPEPTLTCRGKVATHTEADRRGGVIKGTNGRDVIVGSKKRDVIKGRGGNDLICAGKGNDKVVGQGGNDKVFGEGGNDKLFGGPGKDKLLGQGGKDKLMGQGGKDKLVGGPGGDVFSGGGSRPDKCVGGPGKDRLKGKRHGCERRRSII